MGYSNLKKQQEAVVRHVLSKGDVFVSLPTGKGKSLCYSVLPLVFDQLRQPRETRSLVLVVSPLITLMKD
jgi:ATP-dependent DNA helicase RecQ